MLKPPGNFSVILDGLRLRCGQQRNGGFHKWGYSKLMVYNRKSKNNMDDLGIPPMT
jgi:hypothetical protein